MSEADPRIRAEIESRHAFAADLLRRHEREALLLADPANVAWLTLGAVCPLPGEDFEPPAVYLMPSHRWLLCSNLDTQWLFDTDLNGLGFNVKEWSWAFGRAALIAELIAGKRVASDRPCNGCQVVGNELATARRRLGEVEVARLKSLGADLAHALEATGRNFDPGDTEAEIAGQLHHRLVHRGMTPVQVLVSADGRLRRYRRHGPMATVRVERTCLIQATVRRHGLHATASRMISLGDPPDVIRAEMECACRWTAVLMAASTPGIKWPDVWDKGLKFLQTTNFEHEWRSMPIGWFTGYRPVENFLVPADTTRAMEEAVPVIWLGNIGGVTCADTVLSTPAGPQIVTSIEMWPIKRIKVAGVTVDRPDILIRTA